MQYQNECYNSVNYCLPKTNTKSDSSINTVLALETQIDMFIIFGNNQISQNINWEKIESVADNKTQWPRP